MDTARWHRLSLLFDRALDLDDAGRESLIAAECAGDVELASQLRRMLDAADGDSALDAGAPAMAGDLAGTGEDDETPAQPGERLGCWLLEGELGRGGMGVVLAARRDDGDTHQRAAIKRLRRRWYGSAQARRFAHERRILARLAHPNIPRLLDHGVDGEGRPWLAQEFIEGEDLLSYADARRLDVRARIDLFRQVCAAVQHAHEHFVVHRDLKPSNILVDGEGHAHVLDFGVAKRLDAAGDDTRTGLGAGYTPQYAAPEQVTGGAISAATDVYALGVILYQLLGGRLPYAFDAGDLSALASAVTTRVPDRLEKAISDGDAQTVAQRLQARSTSEPAFRRFVRGDLWRILQTALAKEPQRRYPSIAAFSGDLKRLLAGRPVSVGGDSWSYRTGKFVRRNRWAVAMAALAGIAILAGLGATAWQLRETRVQRDAALAESHRNQAVRDYLLGLFRESGDADARAADVLRQGAGGVLASYRDDPRTGLEVANTLGDLYGAINDANAAVPLFEQVLASPDAARFPEQRAHAQHGLANAEFTRGNMPRARQLLDAAQAYWARDPQRHALPLNESRVLQAQLQREAGDNAAALATLESALAQRKAMTGGKPDRASVGFAAGVAMPLLMAGEFARAREVSREAYAQYQALGLQDRPEGLAALNNIVTASMQLGEFDAATDSARQLYEARMRLYPDTADTAVVAGNYGMLLRKTGKVAEAVPVLREALRIALASAGAHSRPALISRGALVEALLQLKQADEAAVLLQQQFAALSAFDAPPDLWFNAYRLRGVLRNMRGDRAGAMADLREAERRAIALGKLGEPLLAVVRAQIAQMQGSPSR